jgi:hypothetical protein
MIRRTKAEVLPELPPKFHSVIEISPTAQLKAIVQREMDAFIQVERTRQPAKEQYARAAKRLGVDNFLNRSLAHIPLTIGDGALLEPRQVLLALIAKGLSDQPQFFVLAIGTILPCDRHQRLKICCRAIERRSPDEHAMSSSGYESIGVLDVCLL